MGYDVTGVSKRMRDNLKQWTLFGYPVDSSTFGSGNLSVNCNNVQDLANEVDALTLGGEGTPYTHPTGDGNLHVPATSTTNSGKVLTAGDTAGAITWETPAAGTETDPAFTAWQQGYTIALGYQTNTNGFDGIAFGQLTKLQRGNEVAFGEGTYDGGDGFSNAVCGHISRYLETVNATPTDIFNPNLAGTKIKIMPNSIFMFRVEVVGKVNSYDVLDAAAYEIKGAIKADNGGNIAFVGTPTITVLGEDNAAWDVAVEASTAYTALRVKVTGAAATYINWHGCCYFTEVRI